MLLARLKAGDEAAFSETFELFSRKIYRHVLFRTSSPETAEDIMSETFIRAWEVVRERAKEIRNLRAFLYRIAGNLVIDHYRKDAKAAVPMTEEMEEVLAGGSDPGAETEAILDRERLRAALGRLEADARDLLVMRYLDDLSIPEISHLTGKKPNAVYVALHRAVKRLQRVCLES